MFVFMLGFLDAVSYRCEWMAYLSGGWNLQLTPFVVSRKVIQRFPSSDWESPYAIIPLLDHETGCVPIKFIVNGNHTTIPTEYCTSLLKPLR